ncbi:hypothetical protein CCACVL1_06110 [Corchorus capsularis]|uniref:Uncharacterized protein n=1 Tax=Corchorus capsularis TaxID=210143 RepID=A0A1R3JHG0_COCAP|nr:hypothetical protein CCACVL1_06110 [Corchorus capsularis]
MATATVENGGILQTGPDEAVKSGDQINDLMMLEEKRPRQAHFCKQCIQGQSYQVKSEDKINNYNLHFRMHHGTNNMRNEKKVLKEINASCHKKGDDSTLSVDVISIRWGYHYPVNMVTDKAIANAPVKGKFWNSLPSKNVIKQEIKIMEKDSRDEDRKEHLRLRAKIEVLKQSISIEAKNDIDSLKSQLLHIETKKEEARKVVLDLMYPRY